MKKLITISLAIIITVAFCFVNVPENKAKAEMPNLDSAKTIMQNFLSSYEGAAKPSAQARYTPAIETWSGTHHVTEDVVVDGSSTLTIEPGTQVIFDGDFSIRVEGNLVASGTAASPITFTSGIATNYAGISSIPDGGAMAITLNHCNIDYAGSATSSGIGVTVGTPASITNCNFTHGFSGGIDSSNIYIMGGSNITIANNNFDSSAKSGVVNKAGSNVTISGNTFQNAQTGVFTVGGIISDNHFNLGAEGLAAIGVAGGQVTIDSNTIGADSSIGVLIYSGNQFVVDSFADSNVTVTHNDISGVQVGIGVVGNTSVATINFNTVHDNSDTGILLQQGEARVEGEGSLPDATIQYNDITGNALYGVAVVLGAPVPAGVDTINATKNYWGSNTGPTHASNPGGTGDAVTDNITFSPWLDSSFTTPPPINSVNLVDGQTVGGIYPINVDAGWVVHGLPLDDMTSVSFYIDGVLMATDTSAPYSFDWDTTVHASPHTVRIVATNVIGTTSERTVNVNVENALPYTGK